MQANALCAESLGYMRDTPILVQQNRSHKGENRQLSAGRRVNRREMCQQGEMKGDFRRGDMSADMSERL